MSLFSVDRLYSTQTKISEDFIQPSNRKDSDERISKNVEPVCFEGITEKPFISFRLPLSVYSLFVIVYFLNQSWESLNFLRNGNECITKLKSYSFLYLTFFSKQDSYGTSLI
ncbi:hypothetical protein MHBO_002006 [Bonamia ostreae]|uniref:Uncharacterized protein n=1 Tax=Bonamia ostreae TaxID=126728 RepID=A0ABV2ALJ7_9EUKA